MISETIAWRLSVWRPSQFKHKHMDVSLGSLMDVSNFHEQLYAWDTREDVLGAVTSVEETDKLREALVNRFSPEQQPQARKLEYISDVLAVIDHILSLKGASDWGDVQEERLLANDERIQLRQHRLLAFRQHLQWIFDTFSLIPDATITVR